MLYTHISLYLLASVIQHKMREHNKYSSKKAMSINVLLLETDTAPNNIRTKTSGARWQWPGPKHQLYHNPYPKAPPAFGIRGLPRIVGCWPRVVIKNGSQQFGVVLRNERRVNGVGYKVVLAGHQLPLSFGFANSPKEVFNISHT